MSPQEDPRNRPLGEWDDAQLVNEAYRRSEAGLGVEGMRRLKDAMNEQADKTARLTRITNWLIVAVIVLTLVRVVAIVQLVFD